MSSTYVEKIKQLPRRAMQALGISNDYNVLDINQVPLGGLFKRPISRHLEGYEASKSAAEIISEKYELVKNRLTVENCFIHLKRKLFAQLNEDRLSGELAKQRRQASYSSNAHFWKESGLMDNRNHYFYIKPMGQKGWLFEMNDSGWQVSIAEKIVQTNTFLRTEALWDNVLVYQAQENPSALRVSSHALGCEYSSYSYYESLMHEKMSELIKIVKEGQ